MSALQTAVLRARLARPLPRKDTPPKKSVEIICTAANGYNINEVEEIQARLTALEDRLSKLIHTLTQGPMPSHVPEGSGPYRPSVVQIKRRVCAAYSITLLEMDGSCRHLKLTRPRQIAAYLARDLTAKTMAEIGRLMGNRDHTTIVHAYKKISALRAADPELDKELTALERELSL